MQTQATHSHSHTHAVHLSTYRAVARAADSGAPHASRREGRLRLGERSSNPLTQRPTQNISQCRWRKKDGLTAAAAAAAATAPPLDATPSGECHWQFLKCGAVLAGCTKNYHRRSGDVEEQMEKSISSLPLPHCSWAALG